MKKDFVTLNFFSMGNKKEAKREINKIKALKKK